MIKPSCLCHVCKSAILVTLLYLGVNQKVAAQLEAVTVLLQLLRNELLDTSQKLCIVMCLAVLSDGNSEYNTFCLPLLTKQDCVHKLKFVPYLHKKFY